MSDLGPAFLEAGEIALDSLLRLPEVEVAWERPSVLEKMTVGMLACHLGLQLVRAAEILPSRSTATAPTLDEVDEHYRRAAWVTATDLDHPALDRQRDQAEAAAGYNAMLARSSDALVTVRNLLQTGQAHETVTIGWQGWSLRRDDFLLTRMVEVVTHSDDLAHSLGRPTPVFPPHVFHPVIELLARLAAERHGQSALISALTRSERMPGAVSAF